MMKDKEFLFWIIERLIYVHRENKNVDYIHKLRAIAKALPEDKITPNIINTQSASQTREDQQKRIEELEARISEMGKENAKLQERYDKDIPDALSRSL